MQISGTCDRAEVLPARPGEGASVCNKQECRHLLLARNLSRSFLSLSWQSPLVSKFVGCKFVRRSDDLRDKWRPPLLRRKQTNKQRNLSENKNSCIAFLKRHIVTRQSAGRSINRFDDYETGASICRICVFLHCARQLCAIVYSGCASVTLSVQTTVCASGGVNSISRAQAPPLVLQQTSEPTNEPVPARTVCLVALLAVDN